VFLDELGIAIKAFSSTVKKCLSIDLFLVVDDSDWDSNRRSTYIPNRFYWYINILYQLDHANGTSGTTRQKYNSL
jgi:hypothetical protein